MGKKGMPRNLTRGQNMANLASCVQIDLNPLGHVDMGDPCKREDVDIFMFGITDTAKWRTKRKMSRKLDSLGGYPRSIGERWWKHHLARMKRKREQS